MLVLGQPRVFEIDRQPDRMKIQTSDRQRVSFDVAIEFALGIAAKRFIEEWGSNPDNDEEHDDKENDRSQRFAHDNHLTQRQGRFLTGGDS